MRMRQTLWIVIPCYNEEAVLPLTAPEFLRELTLLIDTDRISDKSRILFVDDGSTDATWKIIQDLAGADPHYIGISQSRNRGHQSSLLAGLMEAKDHADVTISIDCDGQDDISAMEQMMDLYLEGYDVVYGVRSKRDTDTAFKRFTAESYYRILRQLGAEVVFNHADYRLISSRVLQEMAQYKEVNLYLRGLVPLVGFRSATVSYERKERVAGQTHYPLRKMVSLAMDGVTSLSVKPLHIISGLGFAVALISFVGIIWAVVDALLGRTVAGWASMTCIICFISGIQLICLGVIGEYIGKIYLETKERPRYVIQERTWEQDDRQDCESAKRETIRN